MATSPAWLARISGAVVLLLLAVLGLARYPLDPWTLAAGLAVYAVCLWVWPVVAWLVLPVVIPAWDLGIWTGWIMLGEADFFVLVTVAILLLRWPPSPADLLPGGAARAVLLLFAAAGVIAVCAGLASPLGAPPSDNAFLRPDNALRLAKGFVEALMLLPFLRHRQRTRGDAVAWLGAGMAAGIVAVTLIVVVERLLFAGIFDLGIGYRVAGPFSSMRVGGGHIGGYIVLALPFAVCLGRLRPRWLAAVLGLLTLVCGGYTLAVTFARTAGAAGAVLGAGGRGVAARGVRCRGQRWRNAGAVCRHRRGPKHPRGELDRRASHPR